MTSLSKAATNLASAFSTQPSQKSELEPFVHRNSTKAVASPRTPADEGASGFNAMKQPKGGVMNFGNGSARVPVISLKNVMLSTSPTAGTTNLSIRKAKQNTQGDSLFNNFRASRIYYE